MTTAVEPGRRSRSARFTAWYGVSAASASGAARHRVEVADRDRQPGGREHEVLREAAVAAESAAGAASQVAPLAQVLLAAAAARAPRRIPRAP